MSATESLVESLAGLAERFKEFSAAWRKGHLVKRVSFRVDPQIRGTGASVICYSIEAWLSNENGLVGEIELSATNSSSWLIETDVYHNSDAGQVLVFTLPEIAVDIDEDPGIALYQAFDRLSARLVALDLSEF